jgi:proline iminopeptidase
MTARFGLAEWIVRDICAAIAAQPQVEEARLFGSRARGDFRPGSDIDIAVHGKNLDFAAFLDLSARLDDLPILFKMDIVHLDMLGDSSLRETIRQESVPLWLPTLH